MTYSVRVLGRPEIATGFGLIGLRPTEVATDQQAAETLRQLLDDPHVGVVLIEESVHDRLGEDLRRSLAKRPLPMVVPFPGPDWAAAESPESYIVELLRQVIGYRVRLK